MRYGWLSILVGLTACSSDPQPHHRSSAPERRLPDPTVEQELPDHRSWESHPWIVEQHIQQITPGIEHDLEAAAGVCRMLARARDRQGVPASSEADDLQLMIDQLHKVQARLDPLELNIPPSWYSQLVLPELDLPNLSVPGHIYRRHHLGMTQLGFPISFDTRIHHLSADRDADSQIQDVIDWYRHLLVGNGQSLREYHDENGQWNVWVGTGLRDQEHYDPSHGFASGERQLFLAFRRMDDQLAVLCLDAPAADAAAHMSEIMHVVPGLHPHDR